MITHNAIQAALSLMPLLDSEKTNLIAMGDSPLSELSRLTSRMGTVPSAQSEIDDMLMGQDLLRLSSARNVMAVPEHDLTMDEIAPIVAQAIGAVMSIARNQVNPMVKSVVATVEKRLDDEGGVAETPIVVVPQYHHAIWRNPVLSDMVTRYEETLQPASSVYPLAIGAVEVDFAAVLKTGISDLDNDIQALVSAAGDASMMELWDDYFAVGHRSKNLNQQLDELSSYAPYQLILVHMLAVHFGESVPDTDNVSLDEFRNYTSTLRAATGRLIARRIALLDRAIATKQMVIRFPNEESIRNLTNEGISVRIVVNHMVYKRWLDEGGCPEILLGSALSDQNTNYQALLIDAERYKKTWMDYERMVRLARRNKVFNSLQNYIGLAIAKEINDLDLETVPHSREVMHADLTTHVGHMCATDVENLYETVRHILCNTVFKHTDALKVLTEFDRLALQCGEDDDLREVAALVAINYATDWVAGMIQHDKHA